ncbi:MAG: peroxiredoxin family protein [Deltaproteobacteria bacterium]|nr:peroxiredoxin family protein [Deltaproteobacteria bacterium]
MQLGELQQQVEQFERRGVELVAVSVDEPSDAAPMIARLGLEYPVLSDAKLGVIGAFGLENPEIEDLALHAIFIVDQGGHIFYRKVARRRPYSPELLDAVDYHRGRYQGPVELADAPPLRPWKGWRLIDAMGLVLAAPEPTAELPSGQREELEAILADLVAAREDPALRKWRAFCRAHMDVDNASAILDLGRWLMRRAYLEGVDYEAPLGELREATGTLRALLNRRAELAADAATPREALDQLDLEIGAARNAVQIKATALGELSQGELRSLWDLKSMLKAMDELHAAELRRLTR